MPLKIKSPHPYNYKGPEGSLPTKGIYKGNIPTYSPPIIDKLILKWEYIDDTQHNLIKDIIPYAYKEEVVEPEYAIFSKGREIRTYTHHLCMKFGKNHVNINTKPEGIRIEYNPARLTVDERREMVQQIFYHFFTSDHEAFANFTMNAVIDRIDIAIDILNVEINRLAHRVTTNARKTTFLCKKRHTGETYYYGTRTAQRQVNIYDKLSQSASKKALIKDSIAKFYHDEYEAVTRVEFREKMKQGEKGHHIGTLSDNNLGKGIERLKLYDFEKFKQHFDESEHPNLKLFWQLYQHTYPDNTYEAAAILADMKRYEAAMEESYLMGWPPSEVHSKDLLEPVMQPFFEMLEVDE
jgi:hypothetical protein